MTARRGTAGIGLGATVLLATLAIAGCAGGSSTRPAPDDGAPVPASTTLRYAPYHAQYRAVSRRHVQQEFNGQVTTTDLSLEYYVSTVLVRGDSGLDVTLTIDSMTVLAGLPMGDASQVAGIRFSATMTPSGEVLRFDAGTSDVDLVHQLATRLEEFFPRLPANGVRLGDSWTDTSETRTAAGDLEITVRSRNGYEALEWGAWAGERGLHIATVSEYTLSGTGSESGQAYDLEGSGRSHAHQYVDRHGRFLGLSSVDTLESTATLTSIGATIPILQTRTDTLAVVR